MFSRFDIVAGHWAFYSLWHGGQNCPFYARLCRVLGYFDPGPMLRESDITDDPAGEWTGAKEVYRGLCLRHGCEPTDAD